MLNLIFALLSVIVVSVVVGFSVLGFLLMADRLERGQA